MNGRDPVKQFDTLQLLQAYERAIDENIISSITDTRRCTTAAVPNCCRLRLR
jgi:hypothetical protein